MLGLQSIVLLTIAYFYPELRIAFTGLATAAMIVYLLVEYQLVSLRSKLNMINTNWPGYLRLKRSGYWD